MIDILSSLAVTRVQSVFNIYTAPGRPMERKNRPSFAIIYKHEGETVYHNCGRTLISNAENAVILPAGSSYTWQCIKGGHYYVIEFEANATSEQILSFPIGGEGERLLRLFRDAEQKHNLRAPGYRLEQMRAVYTMLLLLLGTQKKTYADAEKRQKIAPALAYISENSAAHINNDALAALCGISTVYFRKLFFRVTGRSPITYVQELRIAKAKRMLRSDYDSLAEIAVSLGYADIYTFSKAFKKHEGISPTQYAKAHTER
ncbi:MAG: helix-turn-helix transcriptional regulator [Clostridia bacterium]|nr:helix-turn-helix transcriptional regulator [Clostridia bacterium]